MRRNVSAVLTGAHPAPVEHSVTFASLAHTRLPPDRLAALRAQAVHTVEVGIGRATVAVRFARASAAAAFAQRFADMPAAGPAGTNVYAVDTPDAAYFLGAGDGVRRWDGTASDDLIAFLADAATLRAHVHDSGDLALHAAVIARDGRAAALIGPSGAGKTTTALAAARHGFALYSDERCIVQDGCVVPFLRAINLRPGGRAALLAAARTGGIDDWLRALPIDTDAAIRPRALIGDRAGGPPVPLGASFLVTGRGAEPYVERRELHDALPLLLRSLSVRETGLDRAARVLAAYRTVPVFALRLGLPDSTVRAIEAALDGVIHA